jgi:hypothetical protein
MKLTNLAGSLLGTMVFLSTSALAYPSIADDEPIPYATASEATAAIKVQPNVTVTHDEMWDSYVTKGSGTYWIVFRSDSEFYPAVMRRKLTMALGGPKMKYAVLCNTPAVACNKLNRWLQGKP